jgi:uncharacterized protein YdaU (DUF1376 family)
MNNLPYFKNYPDDYLTGSIRFCSYETQGIFAILVNVLWKRGGYLPDNIEEISMITGIDSVSLSKALEQLKQKQSICFSDDHQICVKFILEQLEKRQKIRDIKAKCGRLGRGKHNQNQGVATQSICKAKQKHMQSIQKAYGVLRAYGSNSSYISINLKEELRIKSFLDVWDSWLNYRKAKRCPNTERALKIHIDLLNKYSPEDAIKIINTSIQANWQGLFPLKGNNQQGQVDNFKRTRLL